MQSFIPSPPTGAELTLQNLGNRYTSGMKLSGIEVSMATLAAAQQASQNFGPGPGNMPVKPTAIPENVKGALAQYSA